MTNSRIGLVAACIAAGVIVLGVLAILAHHSGPNPNTPAESVAAPQSVTVSGEQPTDWHKIYENAMRGAGWLGPDFTVGTGYVTAGAIGPHGELLLGTEDEGIFVYDPTGNTGWIAKGEADGLGDNSVYALATDHAGRIWIGQGKSGVTVWNGKEFRHYGVGDGPLGERVFSIAVGPDGSVWLATSAGLTRYDEGRGTWRHYTTAQGLPGLQAAKLAFGPDGKLYAAMQASGLAIASPDDDYSRFQAVEVVPPDKVNAESGPGLPSNLCNDVVVTSQGHVYVATCYGLARSLDGGKSFWYFRGTGDIMEPAPAAATPDTEMMSESTAPCLGLGVLDEDFVSTLATDEAGRVYLGYRKRNGRILEAAGTDPKAVPQIAGKLDCAEPTAMVTAPGGYVLIPQTKDGARLLESGSEAAQAFKVIEAANSPLPKAAGIPSREELTGLLKEAREVGVDSAKGPVVVALEDDWATQGAYLGRHGKYFAALAAMVSPSDLKWGTGADQVKYGVSAGEGALRYYVFSNHTNIADALEMPMPYLDSRVQKRLTTWEVDRREAEWNDFGGAGGRSEDGPHVYVGVQVPAGLYVLSVYFHNKDGHTGTNSLRDYAVSVREGGSSLGSNTDFGERPELARSRVRQFWHGGYKQFLVQGPTKLQVQVDRNHSQFAIVAGVMLDEAVEKSTGYFATREEQAARRSKDEALRQELGGQKRETQPEPTTAAATADALLAELDTARAINPRWWGQERRRDYEALLRFYRGQTGAEDQRKLATCCYYLQMFEEWEKLLTAAGETPPRTAEKALRWSGNNNSFPTENYELVRAYLAKQKL